MAITTIDAPKIDQPKPLGYGQTAEDALAGFKEAGAQVAESRGAQATATGSALAGAGATEDERRRLRRLQEEQAAKIGAQGAPDATSKAEQETQLGYLKGLQETGGAQALTAQQQGELVKALQASAYGTGTIAEQQLKQALAASQAQTASQVASLRGINPAAAQRLLVQQQAGQAATTAGKAAELGLTEKIEAQKVLAQTVGQIRQQDIAAQESMSQQLAAALTTGRAQDISSGQLQAQRDQIAANILQGIRSGDVDAVNSAVNAANAQRSADLTARAQELNLFTASGQFDTQAYQTQMQAAIQQAQMDFEAGKITREERDREAEWWSELGKQALLGTLQAGSAILGKVATGGKARGGRIDGRATMKGDHPANDTVPALLSPGEIVIPRTIATAKDAPEKAAKFVEALQKAEAKPLSRSGAARRIAELEAELAALKAAREAR
jgi:hypothetical protein